MDDEVDGDVKKWLDDLQALVERGLADDMCPGCMAGELEGLAEVLRAEQDECTELH